MRGVIDTGILRFVRRQNAKQYTGMSCPVCRLEQWRCSSGITCDNGHGYDDTSDIPFADAETDHGESLDEILGETPKRSTTSRKGRRAASPSASPESLALGEMGRIVERVFRFDFDESYEEVMRFLSPGDDRRLDLGFLQSELDRSSEMAVLAHRLFTNAREACVIFEIDRDLVVSSMRDEARHLLEEDKRNGNRVKTITDADVTGMMKMRDPAKWRDLRVKSVRMEATRDHLERLADLARKRIDALKTLVEKR